jgi:hypothetical protein
MNKGTNTSLIKDNLFSCLDAGISILLFIMFGFPRETYSEAKNTMEFTREILDLAKNKFGLTYSTAGASPFGLDIFSENFLYCQKYGLQPHPIAEDDISLDVPYSITEGINPKESLNLVNEFNKTNWLKEIMNATKRICFQEIGAFPEAEGHNFLGCCGLRQTLKLGSRHETKTVEFFDFENKIALHKNQNLYIHKFNRNPFSKSKSNSCPILCDPTRDMIYTLSNKEKRLWGKLSDNCDMASSDLSARTENIMAFSKTVSSLSPYQQEIIKNFARLGILETKVLTCPIKNIQNELIFLSAPHNSIIEEYEVKSESERSFILFDYSRGILLQLNRPAEKIWQICKKQPTLAEILNREDVKYSTMFENEAIGFIKTMFEEGFLFIFSSAATLR